MLANLDQRESLFSRDVVSGIQHDHSDTTVSPGSTRRAHDEQPRFKTPDAWLDHYHLCIDNNRRPWPPWSRDELLLAEREGLLEVNPQWIPGKQGLQMLDLPPFFGRRLPPFGERFQERFLATLQSDPDFRSAVTNMIGHAQ